MTIRLEQDVIHLEGDCRVDDAEPLFALLEVSPGRCVDVSGCGRLHSAVAQVLLHLRPELVGAPADPFTRDYLVPAIKSAASHAYRPDLRVD